MNIVKSRSIMSRAMGTLAVGLLSVASAAPMAEAQTAPVFSNPLASTNPYAPFEVGAIKVYRGKDEGAKTHVVDDYAATTRVFAFGGQMVECHLVRELEFESGEIKEISLNYFAEADNGDVYYFGETVDIYEDGVIDSHDGSWLVGGPTAPGDPLGTADAPAPGLFMPFDPAVGDTWKPEDLFPLVDETVELKDDQAKVKVPLGKFQGSRLVEETSDIPDSDPEKKWYVAGHGLVKAKGKGEKLLLEASTFVEAEDGG